MRYLFLSIFFSYLFFFFTWCQLSLNVSVYISVWSTTSTQASIISSINVHIRCLNISSKSKTAAEVWRRCWFASVILCPLFLTIRACYQFWKNWLITVLLSAATFPPWFCGNIKAVIWFYLFHFFPLERLLRHQYKMQVVLSDQSLVVKYYNGSASSQFLWFYYILVLQHYNNLKHKRG